MGHFKFNKTSRLNDGSKTYHYATIDDRFKAEIDTLSDGRFKIALCSVPCWNNEVDGYAKTRKTLLTRLDKGLFRLGL